MRLVEQVFSESLQPSAIDREAGVIRGVRVCGRTSKNGYEYTEKALVEAAKLYEGVEVNIDHPPRGKGGIERSVQEGIGELRNCKVLTEGVYADLHYVKSHPWAGPLVEKAERFPKRLGLSHVADGDRVTRSGKQFIESVSRVVSVDVVSRPATNAGLFESESEGEMKKKTVKQVLESAADGPGKKLLTRLVEESLVDPTLAVDMPSASTDPADEMKAALKRSAHAVIDEIIDGGLDRAEGMGKLKGLFGLGDKVDAALNGGGDKPVEETVTESTKVRELQGKMALMEAKNLILELGRKATDELIEAVASLPHTEKRKRLVESFPAVQPTGRGDRPKRTGSILRESDGGHLSGAGSYAELSRERRWAKESK